MGMAEPSKDSPSGDKAKYDNGSVTVELLLKVTTRVRLERLSVLLIGKVVSGKVDEFGPV
jgi:hypothetical protein